MFKVEKLSENIWQCIKYKDICKMNLIVDMLYGKIHRISEYNIRINFTFHTILYEIIHTSTIT